MSKVVDLTLPFIEGMRGFSSEPARTLEKDGWNARTLHLYSHAGTHMDAPFHFGVTDLRIDQMPVSDFIVDAWVVSIPNIQGKELIYVKDLGSVADTFQPGDSLLLYTGWSKYAAEDRYRNDLPRISRELAEWCGEKKVKILGVEPPSVADVNDLSEVTEIHQILLGHNVIIVEGLTNLDKLTQPKVTFIALPLKIAQGDGAPCRAIAIEEDPS